MDKYRKNDNVANDEAGYNPPRYYQKIPPRNDSMNPLERDNLQNRRGDNGDYQRNDNYPQRNYPDQRGGNRETPNKDYNIASPQPYRSNRGDRGSSAPYTSQDNYKPVQNYRTVNNNREPSTNNSRLNTLNDISKINPNDYNDSANQPRKNTRGRIPKRYNDDYDNYDNSPNEFDISSIDGGDKYPIKYARSPEPRIQPKAANALSNKYRMDENKLRDPERSRIKDQNRPRRQKNPEKSKDEKIDELLKIIDELNSNIDDKKKEIRNLKIDNIKKDKIIKSLTKNQNNNIQAENNNEKIIESNNEEEELDENILDTDIIQTQEEINFIENRLKQIYYFQDKNIKYQLLYKGTKNGDKALNFHTLVDGIKNTLTLVQSKKGIRF